MASRLSDSSDSSSDEDVQTEYRGLKRKSDYSFNVSSEQQPSKIRGLDSSYNENYYNRESEGETTEDEKKSAHSFDTPNITNFYDRKYSTEKSDDDESEGKSDSSYHHGNELSSDNISKPQNESSKDNKANTTNFAIAKNNDDNLQKGSFAERMMKKWGFEQGKGLGRDLQGRSEPVSASTQKGRRGLGLEFEELKNAHIEFNPDQEIVEVKEEILWLQNTCEKLPSTEEVNEWENKRKEGVRKETINDETNFCDEVVVKSIINSKSVFDRLDKNEMREARTRSNPFETIRGAIFLNRAAVKMANMDRACDFMFTQPHNLQPDELLYFADVCAGPGGFSEYILWRKKWHAKGFGFTLKNENDFKLHDFHAGPCETFHPYYGPKEDGDVYDPKNQKAFRDLVMTQTGDKGVHFMMADGGFSVEGQENIQEILSKQLYLCQCLVALMIVRDGGHFVTKLFDLFTPFSAGLVYIMYRCFNQISIFKPNTSRPANSERYLICQGKRTNINHITDYLFKANKKLLKNDKMNDIIELVPLETLTSDTKFLEYLKESNEILGQKQIIGLKKIAAYTEDKNLFETRQKSMREQCLQYWKIPDEARTLPRRMNANEKARNLLQDLSLLDKSSYKHTIKLTKENISNTILVNEHDWFCMPCSSGEDLPTIGNEDRTTTFYLGMGRSQVYKYCDRGQWEAVRSPSIELPRDTLVYGEMTTELRKEGRSQTKTYGLHILDAFMLGSEDISKKYLNERQNLIQIFCTALWKPSDRSFAPVRAKELFPVDSVLKDEMKLESKIMKNGSKVLGYFPRKHPYENDSSDPYYYIPRSIVFFKATEEPWARHKSSSNQQMYFYNKKNKQSHWEVPDTAKANFAKVIQTRVIWNWPSNQSLTMNDFVNNIHQKNMRHK